MTGGRDRAIAALGTSQTLAWASSSPWRTAPARFAQAAAPFVFDLLLSGLGAAALAVTAALGVLSFAALARLAVTRRTGGPRGPAR